MKRLIATLVARPVGVGAACVLVLAAAAVACWHLPVSLLPPLDYPALAVWTPYPDTPPDQVEREVTRILEEIVAGTPGLVGTSGRSQLGGSLLRLDLAWQTDLDEALLLLRERLDRVLPLLPERAERPILLRLDPSDRPILLIAARPARSPGGAAPGDRDLQDVLATVEEVVARRIEQLDPVARVRVSGGRRERLEVLLRPDRLDAQRVELGAVATALSTANVSLPGGILQHAGFRYAVEIDSRLSDTATLARLPVERAEGEPVPLGQLAEIRQELEPARGSIRIDGERALLLLIERRPHANTVAAVAEVRRVLAELEHDLPAIDLEVVIDESVFVVAALAAIAQALAGGLMLACGVLAAFRLHRSHLRAVALSMPLSVAGALVLMHATGVTVNLISLAGLTLGVGLLVDGSIVVSENVARWREGGSSTAEAAAAGAAEVAPAIVASTLTTIAVFGPLTLAGGLASRLFRDQALAVIAAVAASLLVALAVVPVLLARDHSSARPRSPRGARLYLRSLEAVLARPGAVLIATCGLVALAAVVAATLPRGVLPPSRLPRVEIRLALEPGADLALLERRAGEVERAVASWPEVEAVLADLGERDDAHLELDRQPVSEGRLVLRLRRGSDPAPVAARAAALPVPRDLTVTARPVPSELEALLLPQEASLVVDLFGYDRADARRRVDSVRSALRARPELAQVADLRSGTLPGYRVSIDRDTLARFGVREEALAALIAAELQGWEATRLDRLGPDLPVVLLSAERGSMNDLLSRQVAAAAGRLPLAALVRVEPVRLPAVLLRQDRTAVERVTAEVASGHSLDEAVAGARQALAAIDPPVGTALRGEGEELRDALRAASRAIGAGIVVVYLLLVVQFESLLRPLLVLASLPLAGAGAVAALALTGGGWNLMSLTGCVLLVGLTVNDAILKVDLVSRRRRAGDDLAEAIRRAGLERWRPVVMTSITTVFGLAPLALGWGEGAALQAPLAVALIGGLVASTIGALWVTPALHLVAARKRLRPASGGTSWRRDLGEAA